MYDLTLQMHSDKGAKIVNISYYYCSYSV